MTTLRCRTCELSKPLDTDHFFKERSAFGWRPNCKECTAEKKKAWRATNPERHKESNRIQANRYYHEHKTTQHPRVTKEHPAKTRSTTPETPEEKRIRMRIYRAENKEKRNQYNKDYLARHPGKARTYTRAWEKKNPARMQVLKANRRAREIAAPINDFTHTQWKALKEAFHNRCAYCGRKSKRLTMDHITPLSKGGAHTLHNIVPACKSCNSRKHANNPPTPVQPSLLI